MNKNHLNELVKEFDLDNMAKIIDRTPDQIEFALSDTTMPKISNKSFNKALVVGMGGSALPVEVLNDAFEGKFRKPLLVSRHYDLPEYVDDQTLVIGSSFSGNTEETLIAIEQFIKQFPSHFSNVVLITAGGELATLQKKYGFHHIHIPQEREKEGFQPRCATGYFVTYLARVLADAGILEEPKPMLEELVTFLRGLSNIRSEAEEIAYWIDKWIPVFYTDAIYERSIARISKIKFNENAKRPAFFNSLPEANHNEMNGFLQPLGNFAIIYLRDPDSNPRIHQRFNTMRTVFNKNHLDHIKFNEWEIPKPDGNAKRLKKIFAALMFSDWCSYTIALLDHINPTPVKLVEDFKKALEASDFKSS